jgi:hypothetical protein
LALGVVGRAEAVEPSLHPSRTDPRQRDRQEDGGGDGQGFKPNRQTEPVDGGIEVETNDG